MTNSVYNPMSKEFQDECKILGLTGRQLTEKYQREGKSIEKDDVYINGHSKPRNRNIYTDEELLDYPIRFTKKYGKIPTERDFDTNPGCPKSRTYQLRFGSWNNAIYLTGLNLENRFRRYTEKELLDCLRKFEKENGRVPRELDFRNNLEYPGSSTYIRYFGSWSNALKLVEMDVTSMVNRGILISNQQKARLAEIKIINHFKNYSIDLAGKNQCSPCDGICPNGKTYDVKSSKLDVKGNCYHFGTNNKHRDEIEIYYLLGFNEDYTKLEYAWRVPGEIMDVLACHISTCDHSYAKFNIKNMQEYDITDQINEIINK